jgi:acyl dehydratase
MHELSVLGDLSIHVGSDNGNNVTRIGFMSGVRYTAPWTPGHTHRVFGQVLAGGVRNHVGASDTDPAVAVGVGYEVRENALSESGFAGRVQIEYVKVFSGGESFPRFSAGVAYRIGR